MKILLARPVDRHLEKFDFWPYLGLGYLATALRKKNHSVEILDCPKEKLTHKQFADYIKEKRPDAVGFGFISASLPAAQKCAHIVKEINHKTTVIVGGPHVSGAPRETLEYLLREADFGFQGEADIGLPLLIDKLSSAKAIDFKEIPGLIWRNGSQVILNPPYFVKDLDSLGFPAWDLIRPESYLCTFYLHPYLHPRTAVKKVISAPISISRGCPYECTFCGCGAVAGKAFRKRSIPNLIAEIKLLYDEYKVRVFMVIDDNFAYEKNFLKEFCRGLISLGLKIRWSVPLGLRLDNLDKDTLKLMEESGCFFFVAGIESGSPRILKEMKKETTLEMIRERVSLVKKVTKIRVGGFFILGYPTETEEEAEATINFARSLKLDIAFFNFFAYSPGSKLYKDFKKDNNIAKLDWGEGTGKGVTFPYHDRVSIKQLKKLYAISHLSFYLRAKIILNLLRYDPLLLLRYGKLKSLLLDLLRQIK